MHVEGLEAGTEMLCVVTEDNSDFRFTSKQAVQIGHKIALVDLKAGDAVLRYGIPIGYALADITPSPRVRINLGVRYDQYFFSERSVGAVAPIAFEKGLPIAFAPAEFAVQPQFLAQ